MKGSGQQGGAATSDVGADPAPPTRKGRQTRHRIIEAAATVFARDGYVAARMSDVAEEASLSMGGLYRYYASKEALFEALIAGLHEQFYAAATTPRDFTSDPYQSLLDGNRGWLQVYSDNRHVMRAFIEAANVDDRFRQQWWHIRDRHVRRFVHVVQARSPQAADVPDAELLAEAMAGMVEHAAFVWFAHGRTDGREVDVEEASRVVTTAWYHAFFRPGPSEDA